VCGVLGRHRCPHQADLLDLMSAVSLEAELRAEEAAACARSMRR
jgi:hypothetical protein